MNFEEDRARRHRDDAEKRGGSTYIAGVAAGDLIDEAESQGIGILGMDGFLVGEFTYQALSRIADFSIAGSDPRSGFVTWSRSHAA